MNNSSAFPTLPECAEAVPFLRLAKAGHRRSLWSKVVRLASYLLLLLGVFDLAVALWSFLSQSESEVTTCQSFGLGADLLTIWTGIMGVWASWTKRVCPSQLYVGCVALMTLCIFCTVPVCAFYSSEYEVKDSEIEEMDINLTHKVPDPKSESAPKTPHPHHKPPRHREHTKDRDENQRKSGDVYEVASSLPIMVFVFLMLSAFGWLGCALQLMWSTMELKVAREAIHIFTVDLAFA